MEKEIIYLGSAPAEEDCAQIGRPGFAEQNKAECLAYIRAIKRVCGEPPEGASLRVKAQSHDFGVYREAAVEFDPSDQAAIDYAYKCEEKSPATWEEAHMTAPGVAVRGR